MKRIKKFGLQMLLLVLVIFALVGCGDKSTSLSQNNEIDTEETFEKAKESLFEKMKRIWRKHLLNILITNMMQRRRA